MNTSLPAADVNTFLLQVPANDVDPEGIKSLGLIQNRRKSPQEAFEEYFSAHVQNSNTRESYLRDVRQFASWCQARGLTLETITPVDVAAYRDQLTTSLAPTSVKRHLSALRALFSFMVASGAMTFNPAREVRSKPVKRAAGKTPAMEPQQMRRLFDSFDPAKLIDLRDRALIGVMAYTFARVTAACSLTRGDYFDLGQRRAMIRLREKGGVEREIPCHPDLAEYLDAWIQAASLKGDTSLFQTFTGQAHDQLSGRAINRTEALQMVKRRLGRAGLPCLFSNHSFRATGITTFLENGGALEIAQNIAGHADSRTTKLYDRRATRLELAEIVRVSY